MRHEKVIKDERGTITIHVILIEVGNFWELSHRYDIFVLHIAPRKHNAVINDTIATPSEILEAKLELWEKIKPC